MLIETNNIILLKMHNLSGVKLVMFELTFLYF